MAGIFEHHQPRVRQQRGELRRGLQRHRIEPPVQHQRLGHDARQPGSQVHAGEALPHRALCARGDAERRQVPRAARVLEVPCHREFEGAPPERAGIPLAQPGARQRGARLGDLGRGLPLGEGALDPGPDVGVGTGGSHEGEPRDQLGVFDGEEQGEQPAPGEAEQRQRSSRQGSGHRRQVGDVLPPAQRRIARHHGPTTAALVVVEDGAPAGEGVELRSQVIVGGAGPAVERDDGGAAVPDPACEQLDARAGEPALALGRGGAHRISGRAPGASTSSGPG